MQAAEPDGDARTSEGVFVATSGRPTVTAGDVVRVTAAVRERRATCHECKSGGAGVQSHLSVTELETTRAVAVLSRAHALPAPERIGSFGRVPPERVATAATSYAVDDPGRPLAPQHDAIDFLESLEGMLVHLESSTVVGPTVRVGGRNVLALFPDLTASSAQRTGAGGVLLSETSVNPQRLRLVSTAEVPLPSAAVGDRFERAIRAIVDYQSGQFELVPCAALPPLIRSGAVRETSDLPAPETDELSAAVLNVHNLAASDEPQRFSALAELISVHLGLPDLLALLEVQDDNGSQDDAWVGAEQTLLRLTAAIRDAGGPAYSARSIDPRDDADGGEPGGNVRPVLLFRSDRGLKFVDRPGAGPETVNSVVQASGAPQLAFSPGRIAPRASAFIGSRKPLAAELTVREQRLFVVVVHLTSKLGDSSPFDRFQPPQQRSSQRRAEQARSIADFSRALLARDPSAKVLVLGDFNDFEFSPPLSVLRAARLTPVSELLPRSDRYTYVFDGNSQALDHILVSPGLRPFVNAVDIVHRHADFPSRVTDHDPLLARLRF
jgi:predicted extracellular nuclease